MRLSALPFVVVLFLGAGCPTGPGPQPCGPATCQGCCDPSGACQSGATQQACGVSGASCRGCVLGEVCSLGQCVAVPLGGGTAGTGGGSAMAGGQGGGLVDGGPQSDGGSTGPDGGAPSDAGASSDAGAASDAGALVDAGVPVDAGSAVDAGVVNPCAGTLSFCASTSRCLDLAADPENCGQCGRVCGQGQVCNRGQCETLPSDCTTLSQGCGPGYFCDPVSKRCMTGCRLTSDCPMGATCSQNTCTCPTGQHACGQTCVSDDATSSCGTRCTACAQPANSSATCSAGACGFTCALGFNRQGSTCVDIDECATNNGGCAANAACTNTPGSRTCTCNAGFTGNGVTCTDVNECLTNNGGCANDATCTNTPGARTCACNAGFQGDGVTCVDLNECASNNGGCSPNAACTNTPGSRTCACNPGFTGNGVTCADVNECLTNNGGCSANAGCTNTPGSRTCACNAGYQGDGVTCVDVNECSVNNGGCSTNATCTNTPGSRTCACNAGFTGNGVTCADVNECLTNNGGCASVGGVCTNTQGSRTCACAAGFTGDGVTCTDVNECLTGNGGCDANALCTNTSGSRTCACNAGYTGPGTTCTDVDECLTNNGGCAAVASGGVCVNTPGSRTCSCAMGFTGTGLTCADVNECLTNNGGCAALGGLCANTPGSRTCSCASGFTGDGLTCTDINECATGNGGCDVNATCTNTPGSRTCACNAGYSGTGLVCVSSGDTCAVPNVLALNATFSGTTSGAVNDLSGPMSALCGGQSFPGPDAFHRFTPAVNGTYLVTIAGSGFTPVLSTSLTCGVGSACTGLTNTTSSLAFRGTAGVPTFITVDSATGAGTYTLSVTSVTSPANDTCAGAIPLTAGSPFSGSLVGAVNDVTATSSCNVSFSRRPAGDVVFSFTPPTSGVYTFQETTASDVVMWVGTACDGTCLQLTDEPERLLLPLTAGTPYFFIVEPWESDTTFTVQVDAIPTVPNDTCTSPTTLALGVSAMGTTLGGVNDWSGLSALCGQQSMGGPDVVYSFTPPSTGVFTASITSMTAQEVWVSSSCGAASTCSAATLPTDSTTFRATAGVPVFLHVDTQVPSNAGPFTLTVSAAPAGPANDVCSAPSVLAVGVPQSGTFAGAVNDLTPTSTCSNTFFRRPNVDVFFSFTPTTSGPYAFRETTASDVVMWVGPPACDGSCANIIDEPEQLVVSLVAGQTYLLALEPWEADATFTVQVDQLPPVPNDTCASPTVLTAGVATNSTTLGAVNDWSGPLSAICGGRSTAGPDVVFSFTPAATGTYTIVNSTNQVTTVTSSCGAPSTCVASVSIAGAVNFRGTAGVTSFISVDSANANASEPFTLTVSPVASPPNDACAAATPMTLGMPVTGSFVGAVNDVNMPASCSSTFAGRASGEVFFTFTPTVTRVYTFAETSGSDVVMWVGASCGTTCQGFTDEPENLSVALTAGQTYVFVVEPYQSDTTFTVVVN